MGSGWLCTREDVKSALDSAETARNNRRVDRAIAAATGSIKGLTHRDFRPTLDTRYFDWPDLNRSRSWRLWLGEDELISATTVTAGGTVLAPADILLTFGVNGEAPFAAVETNIGSNSVFEAGDTHQRAIGILGLYGYRDDEEVVGSLSAGLAADDAATASINWTTADIGVGDLLRIGAERMTVADKSMVDTGQDLQSPLTASTGDTLIAVTSGTQFGVDQVLLLDAERVLVVDVAGNNLVVKRAWDGSVLGAHTGSSIYSLMGVDVDRAQQGTTLAAHLSGALVYRHLVPGLVNQLAVAESLVALQQQAAGYAHTERAGEGERVTAATGLADLREQVRREFGRKIRAGAI